MAIRSDSARSALETGRGGVVSLRATRPAWRRRRAQTPAVRRARMQARRTRLALARGPRARATPQRSRQAPPAGAIRLRVWTRWCRARLLLGPPAPDEHVE